MKNWTRFLLFFGSIAFVGCNGETKKKDNDSIQQQAEVRSITLADFKKIKGVDNVQEVPYMLFTKLDSVRFYLSPNKDAAFVKVGYNKLDNYYGFEEFDDFYAIHFSIENNLSNSIEAFVLKSEFTASFDMTLKGLNLYEIRSSTYKEKSNYDNKSFAQYGEVVEVTEEEYRTALKSKIDEVFSKNPHIKLKDNNWIYTRNGHEKWIQQYKNFQTEDGLLSYDYVGHSAFLNLEIFKEDNIDMNDSYYVFYDPEVEFAMDLFSAGYPHIVPSINRISSISNNNDVGVDFLVAHYLSDSKKQMDQLYVNFTNFKFSDDKNGFWINKDTFYAEVHPTNSKPVNGKKQRLSYIKIQLKSTLFD